MTNRRWVAAILIRAVPLFITDTHAAENRPGVYRVLADIALLRSCNTSVVTGLAPGRQLLVRAGPSRRYPVLGRLSNGEHIYVCNEHGQWSGIVYSGPDGGCRARMPRPATTRYNGSCRTGWVHDQWIEILTG